MGPEYAGPLPEGYIHTYIHTYIPHPGVEFWQPLLIHKQMLCSACAANRVQELILEIHPNI